MKNVWAYLFGTAFFAAATYMLIEDVKALPTAHLLVAVIIGFYLASASLIAPATMSKARAELTAWWSAYKNPPGPPSGGMGVVG